VCLLSVCLCGRACGARRRGKWFPFTIGIKYCPPLHQLHSTFTIGTQTVPPPLGLCIIICIPPLCISTIYNWESCCPPPPLHASHNTQTPPHTIERTLQQRRRGARRQLMNWRTRKPKRTRKRRS
jgi:hypothetical protein